MLGFPSDSNSYRICNFNSGFAKHHAHVRTYPFCCNRKRLLYDSFNELWLCPIFMSRLRQNPFGDMEGQAQSSGYFLGVPFCRSTAQVNGLESFVLSGVQNQTPLNRTQIFTDLCRSVFKCRNTGRGCAFDPNSRRIHQHPHPVLSDRTPSQCDTVRGNNADR